MAKRITVYNLKGGVGKTFLVFALSMYLQYSKPNSSILVVDMDQQSNSTSLFTAGSEDTIFNSDRNVSTLFSEEPYSGNPYDLIFKTEFDNIYILPSTLKLSVHEIKAYTIIDSSARLKQFLDKVDQDFDYIVIDNPPALNIYTTNSFMAAEYVVIPILADKLAMFGLTLLANTLKKIVRFNQSIKVTGLVPNMIDNRYKAHKQLLNLMTTIYHDAIILPPLGRRSMYQRMIDRRLTYEKFLRYTAYKEDVDNLGETMAQIVKRIEEGYNASLSPDVRKGVIER